MHIRGGINLLTGSATFADEMLREQRAHPYDTRYWDPRRQRVLNKRARYSVVFGDEASPPSADFKQSSIIAYRDVPHFQQLRALLPTFFGNLAANLESEGNHYFHSHAGISFHGDRWVTWAYSHLLCGHLLADAHCVMCVMSYSERRITLCLSLGATTTLRFYWRAPFSVAPASAPVDLQLEHGDIYIMSQKATGNDWQQMPQYRLVHGAGASMHIHVGPGALQDLATPTKGKGTKRKAERDLTQQTLSFAKRTSTKALRVD